jgi:hypothetical protein
VLPSVKLFKEFIVKGGWLRETHMQLLGDGLVHVDYGEPEQVFLVRMIRVPRVPLLDTARSLGDFGDGVEVWSMAVPGAARSAVLLDS